MVPRARRILLAIVAGLLAVPLSLMVLAKATRTNHSHLMHVHNSVVRVRNSFTDFYAARVGDKAILFDAGVDTDGKALDALLGELKLGRDDVTNVFLTHGHFDHVAASPLCKKARIHVGIQDSDMLAQRAGQKPFVARTLSAILPVPAVFATDAFIDRAEIPVADKTVVAIPCPGHTPGSYVLWFDGVLFAGDSLQISDGKLDFAARLLSVDEEQNRRSVATLKQALDGRHVDVVCTGHQGCTGEGEAEKMLEDLYERAKKS